MGHGWSGASSVMDGYLVVARDGDVHVAQRRVRVAQGNGWQVNVGGFREGLVVSPGIGDHQKPRLPEGGLDLVSEGSRGEAASNRSGSSGGSGLQHSRLAGTPGDRDTDISWVFNGTNDALPTAASPRFSSCL